MKFCYNKTLKIISYNSKTAWLLNACINKQRCEKMQISFDRKITANWFSGGGGGGAGVQAHPQKIWFVKNLGKILENLCKFCERLGKIHENRNKISKNLGKLSENTGKNGAQHCLIPKMAPNVAFFEVIPDDLCGRKYSAQKLFRQVWGNLGKNLSHPQTFGCSYTYEMIYYWIHSFSSASGPKQKVLRTINYFCILFKAAFIPSRLKVL